MRRTDEAFKNELFRRYGQYKKNRRNLRILAAAPGAVSLVLICALLIVPNLDLWQSLEPAGDQINDVNPSKDPGDNDTPSTGANVPDLEEPDPTEPTWDVFAPDVNLDGMSPTDPFYPALRALMTMHVRKDGIRIISPSSYFPQMDFTPSEQDELEAVIEALEALLKSPVQKPSVNVDTLDAPSYTLRFNGTYNPSMVGGVVASYLSYQFELKDGKYLRCYLKNNGVWEDWYEIDPEQAKALTDLLCPGIFDDDYIPEFEQNPFVHLYEFSPETVTITDKDGQTVTVTDSNWLGKLKNALLILSYEGVSRKEVNEHADQVTYSLTFDDWMTAEFKDSFCRVTNGHWFCSETFEMNYAAFEAVRDLLDNALQGHIDSTPPESDRPYLDLLDELQYTEVDSIKVTAGDQSFTYEGDEAEWRLDHLKNLLASASARNDAVDPDSGETITIEVTGRPLPRIPGDDVPDVIYDYTFELHERRFLRYNNDGWYEIDSKLAGVLLESFGVDPPPSTAPAGTTPSEAFDLLETFAPDRIEAAISSYYENSRTITDKAEIGSIVELLKKLVRGGGIELADIVDEPSGKHRYTIRLQNDAEGLDLTFEFVEPYIRIINGENVGDWYKVDITVTGAESLFPALGVNLDHSDQLFKTLYGGLVMLNQIDVHTITATWIDKAAVGDREELLSLSYGDDPATKQAIIDALEAILNGIGEEADEGYVNNLNTQRLIIDLSGNPSPEYPGQNYDTWVREYTFEIADGKYLRYTGYAEPTGESGQSGWYAIDSDAQNALLELIESARPSVTPPESSVQPISPVPNPLTPLFTENKLSSITVRNDLSLSATLGSDDAELIARIGDTLTSLVCYDSSQVDVDAISRLRPYKLKLTFADGNTAEIDFRSEYFFFDGAWYFIDSTDWQVLEVLLQAAYNTRGPLSEWTIDSYALTQTETYVWANNALQKSVTVTDAGLLQEIGDLLVKFNEHAFLPNNTTLAWLIENDPTKFAGSPALYYVVELVTHKAYAFILYDRYLFANGVWWEIVPADYTAYFEEYLCLLESYLCGDPSTSAADKLFGNAKIAEIVVNTKVAGNYNVISDADRVKQITTLLDATMLKPANSDNLESLYYNKSSLYPLSYEVVFSDGEQKYVCVLWESSFGGHLRINDVWYTMSESAFGKLKEALAVPSEPLSSFGELLETSVPTAINVDYTTNGQYCTGSASFLSWNDEGEAKLTRILDFLRTLKLTPADDQSLTGEQLHVYFTYLHNSFYTFNLCGRTLNIDGHGTYQISESDAVTLHALLTDSEGFDAASNPIKPLLVGAEIQTMSAARYYSSEEATITEAKDSGAYILAMTELLSSLTLSDTARQPLTADTLDLTVNFTCTTDRDSDIHNQLAFQLHNGRYLYLQVTPGASYWYEIPTAEGEALISLVEGMR